MECYGITFNSGNSNIEMKGAARGHESNYRLESNDNRPLIGSFRKSIKPVMEMTGTEISRLARGVNVSAAYKQIERVS